MPWGEMVPVRPPAPHHISDFLERQQEELLRLGWGLSGGGRRVILSSMAAGLCGFRVCSQVWLQRMWGPTLHCLWGRS